MSKRATPRPKRGHAARLFAATVIGSALAMHGGSAAFAATVTWNGPAANSWATGASWSNGSGPAANDTAFFGDAGSSSLPGEPTSFLNAPRTIGGLTFNNTSGKFHTLDLSTHALTVTGNLNFNLDQGQNTTTVVRNGALTVSGAFANVNVARAVVGNAVGVADLTGLSSLTANVQEIQVGTTTAGNANGTLRLPSSNNLTANRITVGGGTTSSGDGDGTLNLGLNNTILTPEFIIGSNRSQGLVNIVSGGTLNLGSPAQRTVLHLSNQNSNTNGIFQGRLLLGNAAVNMHLDTLVVAQKEGGPGNAWAQFSGGGSGSINIGTQAARGNVYVANSIVGGSTIGTVDWGNLDTLTACVNEFHIGRAQSGNARGSVVLPATSTIDAANSLTVGSGVGDQTSTLHLGNSTVIRTPSLSVGTDFSSGAVTIRSGGTLALGTPAQRTNLNLATAGATNTGGIYVGTLDLSNATVTAYLGNVVIANKTLPVGAQQGNLYISNLPGNMVDATSITLGGQQSTGTLRFGGGQLFAGSIAAGVGTAVFDWTGGRLAVATFGTPTIPFNLVNTNAGTLAPGTASNAIGTTTVHGNYTQGAAAAMHIQVAGNTPGTGNDLVNVNGVAALGGRLTLDVSNGFVPSVGQTYAIANYTSRSGAFAFVDPPVLPQDVAFNLSYGTTQLHVQMVAPTAKSWTSASATGFWSAASNWSGGTLPTTSSDVSIVNGGGSAQRVTVSSPTTVHRVNLLGNTAPVELEILAGVPFGVANQIVLGANATLSGAGEIFGGVTTLAAGAALHIEPGGTLTTAQLSNDGSVTVAGGGLVRLAPGGGGSRAGSLVLLGDGALDVADNAVVFSGDLGTSGGSTYSGLTGKIQSARNGGAWDGPGITTSLAPARTGLTSLGIVDAQQAGYVGGTFGGVLVVAGDVLVAYTYAGDANLDGFISADDYTAIDFAIGTPGAAGWGNGDFNYDGFISADDYTAIDFNLVAQGSPLLTSGLAGIAGSGATVVPEPLTGWGVVMVFSASCLARRYRVAAGRRSG